MHLEFMRVDSLTPDQSQLSHFILTVDSCAPYYSLLGDPRLDSTRLWLPGSSWTAFTRVTSQELLLKAVSQADVGTYGCSASNGVGDDLFAQFDVAIRSMMICSSCSLLPLSLPSLKLPAVSLSFPSSLRQSEAFESALRTAASLAIFLPRLSCQSRVET